MTYVPEQSLSQSAFGDTLSSKMKPIVSIKATYGVTGNTETFQSTGGSSRQR